MLAFFALLASCLAWENASSTHTTDSALASINTEQPTSGLVFDIKNTGDVPNRKFKATAVKSGFEPNVETQKIPIWDCDQITPDEVRTAIEEYPAVEIYCEQQNSIVYPSVLDGAEEVRYGPFLGLQTYKFTEFAIERVDNTSSLKIPLALCMDHLSAQSTGSVEVRLNFGLGLLISGGLTATLPLPYVGFSSAIGGQYGVSGSILVGDSCKYLGSPVRPFISVDAVNTTFHVRQWVFGPYKTPSVKKSPWSTHTEPALARKAPLVSCVSEQYLPGVCEWAGEGTINNVNHLL